MPETEAWLVALRCLNRRDFSVAELRERLTHRCPAAPASDVDATLERLCRLGYLDDRRYAEGIARRQHRRGRGSLRARRDLERKGIAADVIDEIVAEIFADERELAERVLRSRYPETPEEYAEKGRASRFLYQRGFPRPVISALLNEV